MYLKAEETTGFTGTSKNKWNYLECNSYNNSKYNWNIVYTQNYCSSIDYIHPFLQVSSFDSSATLLVSDSVSVFVFHL